MKVYSDPRVIRRMLTNEPSATLATKRMSIIKSGSMIGLKVEHLPLSDHPDSAIAGAAGKQSAAVAQYSALAKEDADSRAKENLETMKKAVRLIEKNPEQMLALSRKRKSDDSQAETGPGKRAKNGEAGISGAHVQGQWEEYRSSPDSEEAASLTAGTRTPEPEGMESDTEWSTPPDVAEALAGFQDIKLDSDSDEESKTVPPSSVAPPSEDAMDVEGSK